MKVNVTPIYEYHELNDAAKSVARDWFRSGNNFDERYSATLEDAKQAGLIIINWSTDSAGFVTGLEIEFSDGAGNASELIRANHGESTATYQAAVAFDAALETLPELPSEDAPEYDETERRKCEAYDTIEGGFRTLLEAAYTVMLQAELDDLASDAYVEESIIANGYTFNAIGERMEANPQGAAYSSAIDALIAIKSTVHYREFSEPLKQQVIAALADANINN